VLAGPQQRILNVPSQKLSVFALNNHGQPALVLRGVLPENAVFVDAKGLEIAIEKRANEDYLTVTKAQDSDFAIFANLINFSLAYAEECADSEMATSKFIEVLMDYLAFGSLRGGRLPKKAMRGLFAELDLLDKAALAGGNCEEIVSAWHGPLRGEGLHDFVYGNHFAIEVKSTAYGAKGFKVSSERQLVANDLTLFVIVVPILECSSATEGAQTILQKAEDFKAKIPSRMSHVVSEFEMKLLRTGLDFNDPHYRNFYFLAHEWMCYEVSESFPKISFGAIPKEIFDIQYSVDLIKIEPYKIDVQTIPIMQGEKW